jgi:hypothetical protein
MAYSTTVLRQVLDIVSRHDFEHEAKRTGSDRRTKGFSSWEQFVILLAAQLSRITSLRGMANFNTTHASKLYHLGVKKEFGSSTIAYANEHRSYKLYQNIFQNLLFKVQAIAPRHTFPATGRFLSFDATIISVGLKLFNWARYRRSKGAVKIHLQLDHAGYLPSFVMVTEAKIHENSLLYQYPIKKGDIAVFDRGFTNYTYFATLCRKESYFITRQKRNASYKTVSSRKHPALPNIRSDKIIELNGFYSVQKCPYRLRRIVCHDPQTRKNIVLLTNNMEWSPDIIGEAYRERWQIEIFFRTLKQYLKLTSFFGTSINAVLTQVYVAMIAYLLLSYIRFVSKSKLPLSSLIKMMQSILFLPYNIFSWANATKPIMNKDSQLALVFS